MSMRKFLKTVGVTSQQQIEEAVRAARDKGELPEGTTPIGVVLTVEALGVKHEIVGEIEMPSDERA